MIINNHNSEYIYILYIIILVVDHSHSSDDGCDYGDGDGGGGGSSDGTSNENDDHNDYNDHEVDEPTHVIFGRCQQHSGYQLYKAWYFKEQPVENPWNLQADTWI